MTPVWGRLFLQYRTMPLLSLRILRSARSLEKKPLVVPEFPLYRGKTDVHFYAITVTGSSQCETE